MTLRARLDEVDFASATIYYVDDYGQLIENLNKRGVSGLKGQHFSETFSWREVVELLGITEVSS